MNLELELACVQKTKGMYKEVTRQGVCFRPGESDKVWRDTIEQVLFTHGSVKLYDSCCFSAPDCGGAGAVWSLRPRPGAAAPPDLNLVSSWRGIEGVIADVHKVMNQV